MIIWDGDTWHYIDITGKIVFDDSFDSASNYERRTWDGKIGIIYAISDLVDKQFALRRLRKNEKSAYDHFHNNTRWLL